MITLLKVVSIIALIFFTILATFVYHYPPEGAAYYAIMANVTATGGLFLLSYIIYNGKLY